MKLARSAARRLRRRNGESSRTPSIGKAQVSSESGASRVLGGAGSRMPAVTQRRSWIRFRRLGARNRPTARGNRESHHRFCESRRTGSRAATSRRTRLGMSSPGTTCMAQGELRAIVFRRRQIRGCRIGGRSNGSRFRRSARPASCIGECPGCARSVSCTLSRRAPYPRVVLCSQTLCVAAILGPSTTRDDERGNLDDRALLRLAASRPLTNCHVVEGQTVITVVVQRGARGPGLARQRRARDQTAALAGVRVLPEIEPFFHGIEVAIIGPQSLIAHGPGNCGLVLAGSAAAGAGDDLRRLGIGCEDADCSASTTGGAYGRHGVCWVHRLLTRRM